MKKNSLFINLIVSIIILLILTIAIFLYPRLKENYRKNRFLSMAEKQYKEDPMSINNLMVLGGAKYAVGKYKEALKLYKEVIKINPEYTEAYYAIGEYYAEVCNDWKQAEYYFNSGLEIAVKKNNLEELQRVKRMLLRLYKYKHGNK